MSDRATEEALPSGSPLAENRSGVLHRGLFEEFGALWRQRRLAWLLFDADLAETRRENAIALIQPFFATILYALTLGVVLGIVLGAEHSRYLPYVAVSISLWRTISASVSKSAGANRRAKRYLVSADHSIYLTHLIGAISTCVDLLMRLLGAVAVIAALEPTILVRVNPIALLAGSLMLVITLFVWSIPLSYFLDRFRLLRAFLGQFLFAMYIATPVLWERARLGDHGWIADLNPAYHLMEIGRAPLLQGTWPATSFAVALGLAALGLMLAWITHPLNRPLVVFRWVA